MGKRKKRLANADISAFCEQLALVMKAGISMQEGLLLLLEDAQDAAGAETIRAMADEMERGRLVCAGAPGRGRISRIHDPYGGNRRGFRAAGRRAAVAERILRAQRRAYARHPQRGRVPDGDGRHDVRRHHHPHCGSHARFSERIPPARQRDGPLSQQGILGIGNAISRYSAVILGVLAAAILVFLLLRLTPKGRAVLASLYAFFFRSLSQTIASGRFASAMSLMLESGMDVDSALDMTLELVEDARTREKIRRIQDYMHGGARFSDAVVSAEMFSGVNARMLTVGFRTGALDTVMRSIARSYDEQVERKISGILSVLEPVLVAVLSLIVGMILLSVMLPLMGIMSAIG